MLCCVVLCVLCVVCCVVLCCVLCVLCCALCCVVCVVCGVCCVVLCVLCCALYCVPDRAAANGKIKLHSRCSDTHVHVPSVCDCHVREDDVLPAGVRRLHLGACRAHVRHFVRKGRHGNI